MTTTPTAREWTTMPFAVCPDCWAPDMVRLPHDWQDRVNRGQAIPIIGCGNPWHYANLARADAADAAQQSEARLRQVTGRDVHRAWRDGMLAQGREVVPERMTWDTLDQRDRDLDEGIAAALTPAFPVAEAVERCAFVLRDGSVCPVPQESEWHNPLNIGTHPFTPTQPEAAE